MPTLRKPPTPKALRRAARERFLLARKAEGGFQRQLSSVSSQVGTFVRGFVPGGNLDALREALLNYAKILKPWARSVVQQMHANVSRRDLSSWIELGRTMGRELRKEIVNAPTGEMMLEAQRLQVGLITSLPKEAAERVHKLAQEAIVQGTRAEEIAKEIMKTGAVTKARAMTIARTEVSRTSALLTESRAKYVGSNSYIWRTSQDSDVRATHRKLNGKVFQWDDPPVSEETGERSNPGQIWNCRCWAEPILPD